MLSLPPSFFLPILYLHRSNVISLHLPMIRNFFEKLLLALIQECEIIMFTPYIWDLFFRPNYGVKVITFILCTQLFSIRRRSVGIRAEVVWFFVVVRLCILLSLVRHWSNLSCNQDSLYILLDGRYHSWRDSFSFRYI